MQEARGNFLKSEFEARIFISLGIVATVCTLSFTVSSSAPSLIVTCGHAMQIPADAAITGGYILVAVVLAGISLLRMWAGTLLTALRVMAFSVQVDSLNIAGPYLLVRNPIYLADLLAICAFSICLPLPGLVMPVLFLIHYGRLIRYEELSFESRYGKQYAEYYRRVPRLFPRFRSLLHSGRVLRDFQVTAEGVRYNALYVLFIPGFILASVTHNFLDAAVVGVPGVIDWAIVHTKLGFRK